MKSETKPRTQSEAYADGVMRVTEAVDFSGICRTALYDLMGRGELAYSQIGSRRLIPRRALIELLAANNVSK